MRSKITAAPAVAGSVADSAARIPSLDGLRAISICLVLMGHLSGYVGEPHYLSTVFRGLWVNIGDLGVRIFFVISGLLITNLLLEEQRKYRNISLARFLLRRAFRIFPAFLVFLLALWVAETLGWLSLTGRDWLHALTYTANYHAARSWEVGHLWSLSVEEQFYAIWPGLLVVAGMRRGMNCATAILIIAPVLRIIYLHFLPGSTDFAGVTFETAADSLAIGCLLAWHRDHLWANERWRRLVSSSWFVPAAFAVAFLLCVSTQLTFLFGYTALNIAIALFVERSVRLHDRGVTRLLNTKQFVSIGMVSYSLYLWQQPFLNRHSTADITQFPQNIVIAFAIAYLSYYYIERPALGLRRGIESWLPVRTPTIQLQT
jgi:peptidoglycan/LPS O-acetylase OafA/YrhL